MTEDIVEKFKIKLQPIKDFTQVWNSQDTQSQAQVALWYPSLQVSMMTSTKVSILGVLWGWIVQCCSVLCTTRCGCGCRFH